MSRTIKRARLRTAAAAILALSGSAAALAPAAAHADPTPHHYYIELGGTGDGAPAPDCTYSHSFANQHLQGGIPVPVCYPASAGPWVGGLTAPDFDTSVQQGYQNALTALEDKYHADPGARFTVTGYSQGAWVADLVLQTIANGGTEIPPSQVDGMLYADPMQPVTGVWNLVPKGWYLPLVATSPGAGPAEFSGVPVMRFCIHNDGVCDATSLYALYGYLTLHTGYPQDGNVMTQTIGQDGGDGTFWYPAA